MTDYYDEDGSIITEDEAHDRYDDILDEVHEDMVIGYLTFSASQVLKKCDPIAYRCGFNDFESSQIEDEVWFEDDPTEDEDEDDTDWEQYWEDYDNGKIKTEDRKDGMFRD